MYVKEHEVGMMQYHEYYIHKVLLLYIPPVLLLIGTIGNVLSFCVLIRKAMRRTSTYNYLAVMALTDMLILYVGLLRLWVGEVSGIELRDWSDWSCKLISLAGYTVSVYSVWLLIAVTVERYIVTVRSLHASTLCTPRRALKVILLILLALGSTNLHFLWTTELRMFELNDDQFILMCSSGVGFEYLVENIWPWVDACLYCFIPFVLICILNSSIIYKVVRSHRGLLIRSGSSSRSGTSGSGSGSRSDATTHPDNSVRVTLMLLSVSFTFVLCTLPMNVVMISSAFVSYQTASLQQLARYKLARTVAELLMYTNHSVNFYLYLLTGQKFRQQLRTMLCRSRKEGQGFGTTTRNTQYTSISRNNTRRLRGRTDETERRESTLV